MTHTVDSDGLSVRLALRGALGVADVADLHARLAGCLSSESDVTIDAGALTRVDTAGLQLVAALGRSAGSVVVTHASAEWHRAWRLLGLPDPSTLTAAARGPRGDP